MSQHPPTTDQEWMTHVLNIHGTPFEHLCQHHLRQSPDWTLKSSRYPVEFPPSNTPQVALTKNGDLDLWGACSPPGLTIELLVECKKNNPDYIDWVFFPISSPELPFPSIRALEYGYSALGLNADARWSANRQTYSLVPPPNIALTDDGRETKGNYQTKWVQSQQNGKQPPKDFTKTSNAAITDAAYQIALATQAVLHKERRNQDARAAERIYPPPAVPTVFLPLIVTTANLWTCQFSADKVDMVTGEVPFNEVHYQQQDYLFFTYPLPPILQLHPGEDRSAYRTDATWEELARFSILVVQSAAFPDLLTHLSKMTKDDSGKLALPTLS